jgi:glycosyltransferase involved in cell wall biosynthesis
MLQAVYKNQTLKAAFILPQDSNDKNSWSGTTYNIYQHLKAQFPDIVLISPINVENGFLRTLCYLITLPFRAIKGKLCLNLYDSYFLPKAQSRYIDNYLKYINIDFIISTNSLPFVFTKNKIPMIIITDATVKLLYDEYLNGKGWSGLYYKYLEKNALKVTQKSTLIVSSSTSTASSLINDYKIPASKIVTIPFGANIENEDIQSPKRIIDKTKPVNFLFVGRDWERKGGDFAVSVCDELIKQKVNVHLSMVGCSIPEKFQKTYLTNYVFLDKNIKEDFDKLKALYEEAHFFMVFSKAEMYGIVFCEAAAYGLPVVTFAVGGIIDIVVNEKTGIMLPKETTPEVFASKIAALISNSENYRKMSEEARRRYETLLNWDSFTNTLKSKIYEILKSNVSQE